MRPRRTTLGLTVPSIVLLTFIPGQTISVSDYAVSQGFDVLALSEAWLGNGADRLVISELVPRAYSLKHVLRANQECEGGIRIAYRSRV